MNPLDYPATTALAAVIALYLLAAAVVFWPRRKP